MSRVLCQGQMSLVEGGIAESRQILAGSDFSQGLAVANKHMTPQDIRSSRADSSHRRWATTVATEVVKMVVELARSVLDCQDVYSL